MPLIKARTNRVKSVRHICRLQEPNRDALVLYARFIGDTADCVLNQLIDTTIAKDRDFLAWRAEHPNETVASRTAPRDPARRRRRRPAAVNLDASGFHRVPVHDQRRTRRRGQRHGPLRVAIADRSPDPRSGRAESPGDLPGFVIHVRGAVVYNAVPGDQCRGIGRLHLCGAVRTPPFVWRRSRRIHGLRSATTLFLILGEQHRRTSVLPAAEPRWLTIPERGLYTGIAIVGAIGTGKTSACMYPYVE